MSRWKSDTPTFVDNKGYTFKFYKYTFKQQQAQATKYFEVQTTKQSVAIFMLFFVDAINGTFF